MTHVVPKVLCAGVAGVGRDADRQALWQALTSASSPRGGGAPDAAVALDDAFGEDAGSCSSRAPVDSPSAQPAGTSGRCGGWGPVFGDEGSGRDRPPRALGGHRRVRLDASPRPRLLAPCSTATQSNEVRDLVDWPPAATPT
jgi:glucosamine kinase